MKRELTLEEIHEELLEQLRDITAICEMAAEAGSGCRIRRIGLEDCFTAVVGDRQYLREVYGMDGKAIAEKAEAFLKE